MSAIRGNGWGHDHNWERVGDCNYAEAHRFFSTRYRCLDCGITFRHWYNMIPNIFEAMRDQKISPRCPNKIMR